MIFDIGAKTFQGQRKSSTNGADTTGYSYKKMSWTCTSYYEQKLTQNDHRLSVRAKTNKEKSEENIGVSLMTLG